jgi:CDGSH iron-sulfur domain-containing protein 3
VSDVTITVRDNGNYKVEGPITILDGEGHPIPVPEGKTVFLCRCGLSATKPFCDSSHRREGFESVVRAGDAATS